MAATTTPNLLAAGVAQPVAALQPRVTHRRVSFEACRALDKLGHAIDYLSDEYGLAGGSPDTHTPQLEAVQLLMAINREIYLSCPVVPSLAERLRGWLRCT